MKRCRICNARALYRATRKPAEKWEAPVEKGIFATIGTWIRPLEAIDLCYYHAKEHQGHFHRSHKYWKAQHGIKVDFDD